ncbi:MAG: hypothetical protein GY698_24725 [Actinomycetia bacterium]|nr:hypothetical protein [Actinomycetes bacterium]
MVRILPEWAQVRCKPQRNAHHTFTIDRHLCEAAANASGLTAGVGRPDLLVVGALLHDIGMPSPRLTLRDLMARGERVVRVDCDLLTVIDTDRPGPVGPSRPRRPPGAPRRNPWWPRSILLSATSSLLRFTTHEPTG